MEQVTISFYAGPEIKALVEQWARDEDRSVSSLLRRLIDQEKERRERMEKAAGRVAVR